MTHYEVSLFQTTFARENLLQKVSEDVINFWAGEREIRNRLTSSKKPVAARGLQGPGVVPAILMKFCLRLDFLRNCSPNNNAAVTHKQW